MEEVDEAAAGGVTPRQRLPLTRMEQQMSIAHYDAESDVLTITLAQPSKKGGVDSLEVDPGVFCDFQGAHRLLRVQVQDASKRYTAQELAALAGPPPMGLADAAAQSGLAMSTLRIQIRNKRLTAEKVGRDWVIYPADLQRYLDSRAPSGRPSPTAPRHQQRPVAKTGAKRGGRQSE